MTRCKQIAATLTGIYLALASPNLAIASVCFGEYFSVEILIESCTDGPYRDPKYGLIHLVVQARTLKLETQQREDGEKRPRLTVSFKPSEVAKVNELRTYLIPTGNGYVRPPIVILSCPDVVGRQMQFKTSTCHCERKTCETLGVDTPAEWWPKREDRLFELMQEIKKDRELRRGSEK